MHLATDLSSSLTSDVHHQFTRQLMLHSSKSGYICYYSINSSHGFLRRIEGLRVSTGIRTAEDTIEEFCKLAE
ncbi:hypothetical protein SprV_0702377500 [Sparganum proliferum]